MEDNTSTYLREFLSLGNANRKCQASQNAELPVLYKLDQLKNGMHPDLHLLLIYGRRQLTLPLEEVQEFPPTFGPFPKPERRLCTKHPCQYPAGWGELYLDRDAKLNGNDLQDVTLLQEANNKFGSVANYQNGCY